MFKLTNEQIEVFKRDGVLVVEDVFSQEEVETIRQNFHSYLDKRFGINHQKVLEGDPQTLEKLGGPRIKSPISNIFYPRWKLLEVNLNKKVWDITSQIWAQTFAIKAPGFEHPFSLFDPNNGYLYIDRVCYRLPDYIREEGGLKPHLDRNPIDPYLEKTKVGLPRWRPIQSFIALTDHFGGASGGLRCVKGFHLEVDDYFNGCDEKSDGGEFYRLHAVRHKTLYNRCKPIDAPAGSFVLWDNRIVHSTDDHHQLMDTREVLYLSFLPAGVPCNDRYAKDQLQDVLDNQLPNNYKKRGGGRTKGTHNNNNSDHNPNNYNTHQGDRDWEENELSSFQKKLLGFEINY